MKHPTLQQVRDRIGFKGFKHTDAFLFWSYWDSRGWKRGGQPMVKWKSALAGWNYRNKKEAGSKTKGPILCKNCGAPSIGMRENKAYCNKLECRAAAGQVSSQFLLKSKQIT